MNANDQDVVSLDNAELDTGATVLTMTVRQVAVALQVGQLTVLAAIDRGELVASNIGGGRGARPTWRIRPADVDAWLESRRRHPAGRRTARAERLIG